MAYKQRYEILTKQEIILGAQFHILALKALVKITKQIYLRQKLLFIAIVMDVLSTFT